MSNKADRVIEVRMFRVGRIGTISLASNQRPKVEIDGGEYEEYRSELERVLEEIGDARLSTVGVPEVETHKDDRVTISERVYYYSPGEPGYEYALAHELSHYKLFGTRTIVGIVCM